MGLHVLVDSERGLSVGIGVDEKHQRTYCDAPRLQKSVAWDGTEWLERQSVGKGFDPMLKPVKGVRMDFSLPERGVCNVHRETAY